MNTTPDLSAKITSVFVGKIENRWPNKAPSAIGKHSTDAVLRLEKNGFLEDSQADLKVHGGPEKAIHHYASENMDYWRQAFPDHAEKFIPGCFGENIATLGLNEQNLCLGDTLTMGSATVQICQGRQPCWKLNAHTNIPQMVAAFQQTARTGWYYRVLETGSVQAGDRVRLIERVHPDWTLDRLIKARFDKKLSSNDAKELAESMVISESWREAFGKKQARGFE
ncbi:MAG: MOSC domain-containing protein [Sneathiella sp.]